MKATLADLLARLFKRPQPIYGPRIFLCRSWLEKQTEEAIWKRNFKLD